MKEFNINSLFKNPSVKPIRDMIEDGPGFAFDSLKESKTCSFNNPRTEGKIKVNGSCVNAAFRDNELLIDTVYESYSDNRIVRLSGTITNDTDHPVRCNKIRSMALVLKGDEKARIKTYSLKGGFYYESRKFPPKSFTFTEFELPGLNTIQSIDSGPTGPSTDNDMPFSVIQCSPEGGIFWALEWPGLWWACAGRTGTPGTMWLEAGPVSGLRNFDHFEQLHEIDILLAPGESLPLPPCVIGLYAGDYIDGCNSLRRYIRSQTPLLDGKPVVPPVMYDSWWEMGLSTSEDLLKPQIDVTSKAGIEYFIQDAGWQSGSGHDGEVFMAGAGNWRKENPKKFPNGLAAVADYAEKKGMKFGLWWVPENCDPESEFAREHPEWLLPLLPGDPAPTDLWSLVDFGIPEVVDWNIETIDYMMKTYKLKWVRWDLNIYQTPCWERADTKDRAGISQIRHLEGLQKVWDYVLKKYPGLLIEGCYGGGRRMDLSCLRRSHSYWCNDMTDISVSQRYENTGANHFIPTNYLNRNIVYGSKTGYPPQIYHSLMGSCLGFADALFKWDEKALNEAAEHISVFKRIRNLLMADYRPLFGQPHSLDEWDGWQFHDPETDNGVIIVFRCLSKQSNKTVPLRWITNDGEYKFVNPYTSAIQTFTSSVLSTKGLLIELNKPEDSRILVYKKVD